MANEVTATSNLFASKGGAVIGTAAITLQRDMAGNDMVQATQTIGHSADEALNLGDVATGGYYDLEVYNRDATNYVELSNATGGSFAAGVWCRIPPLWTSRVHRTGVVYAKADTAACDVTVRAVEA
jgi:hypothetical protein